MALRLVTVVGANANLLPHMLEHYKGMGVDSMSIHIHSETCNDPLISEIKKIAQSFGASIASLSVVPWAQGLNPLLYRMSMQEYPDDWFITADEDEFQVYPQDVREIIRLCEEQHYDYVEGFLLDRLAEDGTLRPVVAGRSIWEQFSLGACLTGNLLGAVANKVVLSKGHVRIGGGHHHARSGVGCPPRSIYVPVHHFKWIDGLIERLNDRICTYKRLDDKLWLESEKFVSYYTRHNRIALEDKDLMIGSCSPTYEYWDQIVRWRIAAPMFRQA
jgi:hypothetical protein